MKHSEKQIAALQAALRAAYPAHPFRFSRNRWAASFQITLPGEERLTHEITIELIEDSRVRISCPIGAVPKAMQPELLQRINYYNCGLDAVKLCLWADDCLYARAALFLPGGDNVGARVVEALKHVQRELCDLDVLLRTELLAAPPEKQPEGLPR